MMIDKKKYVGGAIVAGLALILGIGTLGNTDVTDSKKTITQKNDNNGGSNRKMTFMEDKTGSSETIDIEQAQKVSDDIAEFHENIDKPEPIENPETIAIQGRNYMIYDDGILLPITTDWKEYIIPGAEDGSYDNIGEFYLQDESPERWTQKITIHKVNGFAEEDCPSLAERLENGILVSLHDRMALEGEEISRDNVSFNIARKNTNDCIFYWGVKGQEEIQFVRVFRSEYTKALYVATSNYKLDISTVDDEFAGDKLAELASIQQLKKKG